MTILPKSPWQYLTFIVMASFTFYFNLPLLTWKNQPFVPRQFLCDIHDKFTFFFTHDTFSSLEHGKFDFQFCNGKNTLHPREILPLPPFMEIFASIDYGTFTLQNMAITIKQKIVHFCFCSTQWQFLIHILCLFIYIVKIAYRFLIYIFLPSWQR